MELEGGHGAHGVLVDRAALIFQHAAPDRERAIGDAVSRMVEEARRNSNGQRARGPSRR